MSENATEQNPQQEWPGKAERWRDLKLAADQHHAAGDTQTAAVLAVAAEIAGLTYIVNGVGFVIRQKQGPTQAS